jgi:hypothetical protein
MLTQQQKEQIAEKGNEFLVQVYSEHVQGHPTAIKALGMPLTFEQQMELLLSSFKTVLRKIKETEPTILTDPHLRKILTKKPSWFKDEDWSAELSWEMAIESAERDLGLQGR